MSDGISRRDVLRATAGVAGSLAAGGFISRAVPAQAAAAITFNDKYGVNVDLAAGPYGSYSAKALSDTAIQGVLVSADWNAVEPTQGSPNWEPLQDVLQAWSAAGKHVSIVGRFASQDGGPNPPIAGFIPSWEVTRLGGEYIKDADTGFYVPNYWNANFQADWKAFVDSLGTYLTTGGGAQYASAVSYVRIGCGLGGEGFYLMDPTKPNFATYKSQLKTWAGVSTDAQFADAWRAWQEMVLGWYRAAIPSTIPVMYPIVAISNTYASNWTCSDGNFVDVDVMNWALGQGGYGLSQDNMAPGGYGNPGYGDIGTLITEINANHPGTFIQFQSTDGLGLSGIQQSITTLEGYSASKNPVFMEWYEDEAVNTSFQSAFRGYQTWTNGHVQ